MDPNANLAETRRLAENLNAWGDNRLALSDSELYDTFLRLAELVNAMDGWLSKGGFLPGDWAR